MRCFLQVWRLIILALLTILVHTGASSGARCFCIYFPTYAENENLGEVQRSLPEDCRFWESVCFGEAEIPRSKFWVVGRHHQQRWALVRGIKDAQCRCLLVAVARVMTSFWLVPLTYGVSGYDWRLHKAPQAYYTALQSPAETVWLHTPNMEIHGPSKPNTHTHQNSCQFTWIQHRRGQYCR